MFRLDQMGVYIHWPFCAAKCPYCDFNSHVREKIDQKIWVEAYIKSLEHYAEKIPEKKVVSIFFGGGTPSLMEPETVEKIIDAVQRLWPVANDLEITLEANPTSIEMEKFSAFNLAGVNRVSIGVQALNDSDLKFFGREHSALEAIRAIDIARKVFDRYSFDLIYARPNQSLSDWEGELTKAISHAQGHLSLYQLTIERNTPFYMRHARGEFSIPDDVQGADFYHLTQDILEDAGLPAYEVSNHAALGQECRHNQIYWHMADYIGVGAGAHGRFVLGDHKYATRDHAAPEKWLERAQKKGCGAHEWENITPEDIFFETLMVGLRLREGVSVTRCEALSGLKLEDVIDQARYQHIEREGWIHREGDILGLSREGMLRLNSLLPYMVK